MKAVLLSDFGSADKLVIGEIPIPTFGDEEILLRHRPETAVLCD